MTTNISRILSAVLLGLVLSTAPAAGQVQSDLRAWGSIQLDSGTFLRITARDGSTTEGRFVAQSRDGVTVTRTNGASAADSIIRTSDISAIEMRTTSGHAGRGAVVGLAVGVLGSLFLTAMDCGRYSGPSSENMCGLGFVVGPPIFGTLGTLVGALIGATQREQSWSPVRTPSP